jgi:hypothetical protein
MPLSDCPSKPAFGRVGRGPQHIRLFHNGVAGVLLFINAIVEPKLGKLTSIGSAPEIIGQPASRRADDRRAIKIEYASL